MGFVLLGEPVVTRLGTGRLCPGGDRPGLANGKGEVDISVGKIFACRSGPVKALPRTAQQCQEGNDTGLRRSGMRRSSMRRSGMRRSGMRR